MLKKMLYSTCLLGVALWCSMPTPALAHRVRFYGGLYVPGVAVNIGVGGPARYYPYYGYRPYVVGPVLYPPSVIYASPAVVYASPPVVYNTPTVIQSTYPPTAAATLQILVAPLQADIYLDGRYLGRAEEFRDGQVQLNVSPGSHTVELRFGTVTHTHTVNVGAGATVVVNDRL